MAEGTYLIGSQDDIDRLAIARSLNLKDHNELSQHQDRLDRILTWAKMKGATDKAGYIGELTKLRNTIGNPSIYDLTVYLDLETKNMRLAQEQKENKAKLAKFKK